MPLPATCFHDFSPLYYVCCRHAVDADDVTLSDTIAAACCRQSIRLRRHYSFRLIAISAFFRRRDAAIAAMISMLMLLRFSSTMPVDVFFAC